MIRFGLFENVQFCMILQIEDHVLEHYGSIEEKLIYLKH